MIGGFLGFLKEGWDGIRKEVAKWSILGSLFLLAIAAAWFFNWVTGIDIRAWISTFKVNGEFSWGLLGEWAWGYANLHPVRASGTGVVFVAFLLFAFLFFKNIRSILIWAGEFGTRRSLLACTGLEGFWPSGHPDDAPRQWKRLRAAIEKPNNGTLSILGASGWETFGAPESPLYQTLQKFPGFIRVVLMDPKKKGCAANRAASVGMKPSHYVGDINRSIKVLRDLKTRGHHIELKVYDSPPNWKMVLTGEKLWLQYYRWDRHVAETPVYWFYNTNPKTGLYHAFCDDFERIWKRAVPYPLDEREAAQRSKSPTVSPAWQPPSAAHLPVLRPDNSG